MCDCAICLSVPICILILSDRFFLCLCVLRPSVVINTSKTISPPRQGEHRDRRERDRRLSELILCAATAILFHVRKVKEPTRMFKTLTASRKGVILCLAFAFVLASTPIHGQRQPETSSQ